MPSKIEWCEETWNPVVGCTKVSAGCKNCYALRFAWRLAQNPEVDLERYQETVINIGVDKKHPWPEWTGRIAYFPERLERPLHWRKPRRVFVGSMGDLFHRKVEYEFRLKIFSIMRRCPQHIFLLLTKRPEIMRDVIIGIAVATASGFADGAWPLPNVWLGVTAENQEQADKRIPVLLSIPAAKHFVSVEPMLGPVDLDKNYQFRCGGCGYTEKDKRFYLDHRLCKNPTATLDLVICGGETGPGARPMDPEWARSLRDQCRDAGVAFFVKQMGRKAPIPSDLMVREWPE